MKIVFKLLLFFFLSKGIYANSAKPDSVGLMVDTLGKIIVLHQVEKGETFYSIARKYRVEPKKLIEFNKTSKIFLDLGDTVKVPTSDNMVVGKKNTNSNTNTNTRSNANEMYVVAKGDNLYQISKKFNVSIEELKSWNHLHSNALSLGQSLIIKKNSQTNIEMGPHFTEEEPEEKHLTFNKIKEVKENGLGGWINSKYLNPQKSLALHKTATLGTIIKVTNKMNSKSVFVKVIGTLPNTDENENIVILISKSAKEILGILDERFQCELEYSIGK